MIHRSGVSRILLKGESYTCNTNLKTIYLEDIWYFANYTLFLDASCLVFNFDDELVETIDFSHTNSNNKSIIHSGDIIDNENKSGKHTININLKKLPNTVKTLVFSITAWLTQLKDILHPQIIFIDKDNNHELCKYQYAEKTTGNNTSVIMAKLYREDLNSPWIVNAIGHLGLGCAGNYGPIITDVKRKFL